VKVKGKVLKTNITFSNNEEVESAKKDEHLVSFDQFPMAVQRRLEYVRTKKYW
jgi:hypothetical protein